MFDRAVEKTPKNRNLGQLQRSSVRMEQKPKILLVDEKVENLIVLDQVLEGLDATLIRAQSGPEALTAMAEHEFALAIVDLHMPEMDGWQLLDEMAINERTATLPVVVVSSLYSRNDYAVTGSAGKVVDFLEKPLNPVILRNKVETLIQLYNQKTELTLLNEELRESTKKAERLTKKVLDHSLARNEFLGEMSRNINTSMNGVIGMLDIALDERIDIKVRECLFTARSSANALVAVMNGIVDMSTIETGGLEIAKRHCSLSEILLDIDSLMHSQMAEQGYQFDIVVEQPVPEIIYTDPKRLRQCLFNIVNYTFDTLGAQSVCVSLDAVQDRGLSFVQFGVRGSLSDRKKRIESLCVMSRMDDLLHPDEIEYHQLKGSEIGFVIAHKLCALMGGRLERIQVESDGSDLLRLMLPIGTSGQSSQMISELDRTLVTERKAAQIEGRLFAGAILVADDDRIDQKVIRSLLENLGLDVTVTSSGEEALREALTQKYDLLFVDMLMPDVDGCEVTRAIRAKGLTVPIIALTGNIMKSDVQDCLAAGCDQHLAKPVDREKMVAVLSQYLGIGNKYIGQFGIQDGVQLGIQKSKLFLAGPLAPSENRVDGPIVTAPNSTE